MTIDNLLIQGSFTCDKIESEKRNDAEGKALITFNGYMEYDEDSDARVYQMLILFDPKSKEITAMKLKCKKIMKLKIQKNMQWLNVINKIF